MPGFLRFVSILFLIFEKVDKQKIVSGFLRFVSILFLIFEKGDKRKNCARFFLVWLVFSIKSGYRDFWGFYVCFFNVILF